MTGQEKRSLRADFHVHTTYCDGADTPREIVRAAIDRGLYALGFSTHSYTFFDESYCIERERVREYQKEISSLREEFKDRIRLYCGVEQDYYSDAPTDGFDYVIGSIHYLRRGDDFYPIDHTCALLRDACERGFNGDIYATIGEYYRLAGDVVERTGADLIGHFDVISKFTEKNPDLFDIRDPRYVAAWQSALDRLLTTGVPFEVNTGALSRGHRTSPYPSDEMLAYIRARGGEVMLSGDSHAKETLCHAFERYAPALVALGFDPAATLEAFLTRMEKGRR